MNRTFLAAALLSASLSGETNAQQVMQILPSADTTCIDEAMKETGLRNTRSSIGPNGEYIVSSQFDEDYRASIATTYIRNEGPFAEAPRTLTFAAQIEFDQNPDDGLSYRFRRSVSIDYSISHITKFNEGGHSQMWIGDDPYGPSTDIPELPEERIAEITQWTKDASQTMAFIFGLCRFGEIFEPSDGTDIRPPALPVIEADPLPPQLGPMAEL